MGSDELDEMMKCAPGPINFTIFLSMFGEKLKGQRAIVFRTSEVKQLYADSNTFKYLLGQSDS